MVYLLSNSIYSQIAPYNEDGSKGCIDCPSKDNVERPNDYTPLPLIPTQWPTWPQLIPADNSRRETWLRLQEYDMAKMIAIHPELITFGGDWDFNVLQRGYFIRKFRDHVKSKYMPVIESELDRRSGYSPQALRTSTIYYPVLNYLENDQIESNDYGDLKYENQYLRDLNGLQIFVARNRERDIRDAQRVARQIQYKHDAYYKWAEKNIDVLSEYLANKMIAHYNSRDYQDAVLWMSTVIAAYLGDGPYFNLLDNIWDVTDGNYAGELIDHLLSQEGINYPRTNWADDPIPSDALFKLGKLNMGNKARDFIHKDENAVVEKALKQYLEFFPYKEEQLHFAQDLFESFADRTLFPHNNYNYTIDQGDPRQNITFQNSSDLSLAYNLSEGAVNYNTYPELYGASNLLHQLGEVENPWEEGISGFVTNMLLQNGIDLSYSFYDQDQAIFNLFEIRNSPYQGGDVITYQMPVYFRNDIGERFWENGLRFPHWIDIPYAVEGAIAIGNGQPFDLEYRTLLYHMLIEIGYPPTPPVEAWMADNETIGRQVHAFVENNRVNNAIPEDVSNLARALINFGDDNGSSLANQFIFDILNALNNNTTFDFSKYLNLNTVATAIGPTVYGCDFPPCDPGVGPSIDQLWALGPGLFQEAADGLGSLLLTVFEYQNPDIIEGALIRSLMEMEGFVIDSDISLRELGELFSVRRDGLGYVFLHDTTIAQDLLHTGLNLVDIVAILAPSRGGGAFLAARGGGFVSKAVMRQYLATLAKGSWKVFNESMSDAAKSYQEFISGRKWNESFELNNVKFDALREGVLGDAKSGMDNFVDSTTGAFKPFFANSATGGQALIDQARRQTTAAEGNPIQWYFEHDSVRKAVEILFEGLDDIDIILIYKPRP